MQYLRFQGYYRVRMSEAETTAMLERWPEFKPVLRPDHIELHIRNTDHRVITAISREGQDIPHGLVKLIAARAKRTAEKRLKLA